MSDYDDDYSANNSDNESESSIDEVITKKPNVNNIKPIQISKSITVDDDNDEDIDDENDILDEDFEDYNEMDDFEDDEDDDNDDNDDNDEETEYNQDGGASKKQEQKVENKGKSNKKTIIIDSDDDEEDDDEMDQDNLQKFDVELNKNYIDEFHPECLIHNYDEVSKMSLVVRDSDGIIIDPFHRTIPFLTKYEKTRVLGQRAKQIENGARSFVNVPENIIDSYVIAELELKEKKIPFIIRRPLPTGASEYWHLRDLEMIHF
jgi:DNA-directed RNA polymerase subunit K/omega